MNSKQRAELQRKLSLNAVPRPPADLAERIKADIPKYHDTQAERAPFTRSVGFNMRIAASFLLAITALGVTVFYVERQSMPKEASLAQPGVFAPAARSVQEPRSSTAPAEEVRLDISEEPDGLRVEPPKSVPAPVIQQRLREHAPLLVAQAKKENDIDREDVIADTQVASGVASGSANADYAPQPAEAPPATLMYEAMQETAKVRAADEIAAAPPAPPQEAPANAGRRAEARNITVTAEAPMIAPAPPARAPAVTPAPATAKLARDERKTDKDKNKDGSIFGISVDPEVFQDIRTTLENGARPRVSAVDVEALVNYFAGPPAKRPRSGPSLEVEASPAPIEAEGDHAILRFTIDTPAIATSATLPAVATDARVDILLNGNAVEKAHRIGDNHPPATESALHYNTSVTGLYALELRPNLTSSQVVATVRLHYVEGGKQRMQTRIVYGKDLARSWKNASRRHRLASLGAIWGETLRDMAPGFDVAKRAEELATQNPKDSRAKELAAAANASADGER
jgi:hypothetical protein